MQQRRRYGGIAIEEVAEHIHEDLFLLVLYWDHSDMNNYMEHVEIVLLELSLKDDFSRSIDWGA